MNYEPGNHHEMVRIRAQKVQNIVNEIGPTAIYGKKTGDLLILSWGSAHGSCRSAVETLLAVSYTHLTLPTIYSV